MTAVDWRSANHADVLFSDEEVWALSQIDLDDPAFLRGSLSIAEKEMLCQRDMRVRGRRLWNYHVRVGDLADFGFPMLMTPVGHDWTLSTALTQ